MRLSAAYIRRNRRPGRSTHAVEIDSAQRKVEQRDGGGTSKTVGGVAPLTASHGCPRWVPPIRAAYMLGTPNQGSLYPPAKLTHYMWHTTRSIHTLPGRT